MGGNPASLPASPPSTIHSVPSMVPSQFVFQKAGTARAFVTGTVLCTVNRHRGEPGHTHGTHGRTRAHGSGIIQTNFTTIQTHDPRTHPHDHPNPRTHPHDPQYRVPVRLPPVSFYRYTGNASRGGAAPAGARVRDNAFAHATLADCDGDALSHAPSTLAPAAGRRRKTPGSSAWNFWNHVDIELPMGNPTVALPAHSNI